uniref:baseplate J/gp47 family protein n=1 Tax=Candidatus Electronema sp. TaxID=2698783 RepID=UPI0040575011
MSEAKRRPQFTGDILNDLPVLPGTCQEDRLAEQALRPDWFHLEERNIATLLAMSRRRASKLRFHNAQNVERDWTALFQEDESAVLADFLSFKPEAAEEKFLRLLEQNHKDAVNELCRRAGLLETWLDRLISLQPQWAEALLLPLEDAGRQLATLLALRSCDPEQSFPRLRCLAKAEQERVPQRAGEKRDFLLRCHSSFHKVLRHLKEKVSVLWEESLRSGQHEPAVGLLTAFLRLYSNALAKNEKFKERHLDFYYWEVLRAGARLAQPDSVHLVCRNVTGREALIRQSDQFAAGADDAGNERLYQAENALHVTDARVARLCTLSLERSQLVAPAWEMGCFVRCRSSDLSAAAEPQPNSEPAGLPLFGEDRRQHADNAQIGLMLAAPELLLSQGRREVSIVIRCQPESDSDYLLKQMEIAEDQKHFFSLFGQFLSSHLLSGAAQKISASAQERVLRAATNSTGISPASYEVIVRLLRESCQGNTLFYRFLTNAFHISLSGASGWLSVRRYFIFPDAASEPGSCGLRLAFVLDQDAEPVIGCHAELHGAEHDTVLPLLRLRLNHQAHFFTYSIFRHFILKKITLETKVTGLRDVQVHNQHGRLDPNQPFQPFGPVPALQSYFIVGSHEAACKQLTDLSFCIEWAGLPDGPEGFAAHYRQYNDVSLTNASFTADFSLLRNGRWVPQDKKQRQRAALFAWRGKDGRLAERQELTVKDLKQFQPVAAQAAAENFFYGPKQGSGFFRWELTGPRQAFGHGQYPALLSQTLVRNTRSKKNELPVPSEPYTPLINALSLNYTARREIDLSKPEEGVARLCHLHPFGVETLHPQAVWKPHSLVPRLDAAGNLYIGIRSQKLGGVQTLYFHLNADSRRAASDTLPRIDWFYAADAGWRRLDEARLLSDTTECFLHSGIVTLDIPDDISRENAEMGKALHWLRASTDSDQKIFSSVRGVYAHAVRAAALQGGKAAQPLVPQTVRQPLATVNGLAEVLQPEASFGGGRPENREAVIARLNERLRHKDRAVTAWDYERLVLEQFPQVRQVKCFPCLRSRPEPKQCPGNVLIVVVPEAAWQVSSARLPRTDAAVLAKIQNFLQQHAAPFTSIEVRSPEYEKIQVRCAVAFADSSSSGLRLAQLNQAIIDYISPWTKTGFKSGFGWSLRLENISAWISGQEGVEHVAGLSVLHITKDASNAYYLADSARRDSDARDDDARRIRPRYPWSLAVSAQQHFINVMDKKKDDAAKETGINDVEIGENFIVNE